MLSQSTVLGIFKGTSYTVIATITSADGITLRAVSENICQNLTLGYLQISPLAEVYLITTLIHLLVIATLH